MMKKEAMALADGIINTGKRQYKPLSGDWVLCQRELPSFPNIPAAMCLHPASCRPKKRLVIQAAEGFTALPRGSLAGSHSRHPPPAWERGEPRTAGGERRGNITLGALWFQLLSETLAAQLLLWDIPAAFTLRRAGEIKYTYLEEGCWKALFPLLLFHASLFAVTLQFWQASHQFW